MMTTLEGGSIGISNSEIQTFKRCRRLSKVVACIRLVSRA